MSHQRNFHTKLLDALRDCVQDRLAHGMCFIWGFWLHAAEQSDELLVTTLGGDTVTLTHAMVRGLRGVDLYTGGRTPTRIWLPGDPGDLDYRGDDKRTAARSSLEDRDYPSSIFLEHINARDVVIARAGYTGWGGIGGDSFDATAWDAVTLRQCPWVFLGARRPQGWPR